MPECRFAELRVELLRSGISPRSANRMIRELSDHFDDLESDALAAGMPATEAAAHATSRIGTPGMIAERVGQYPALRSWMYRYPMLARIYCPLAYVLLLPAAPVFAGIANPGIVIRWIAALTLSAGVTAGMLLFLQIVIATT
ncbi:MAG: hypothetical protein OEV41_08955 [Gammaproteobacteria bacterium]|nr:hypothetical protein [Gammaproteobacteria bacterium]